MKKINCRKAIRAIKKPIVKHLPGILTGLGAAGMLGTVILAVQATPKAMEQIEARKKQTGAEVLAPVETVKAAWKCYIPVAFTGVTSLACLIAANSVHSRRNAALAAACSISESALMEYKDKALEIVGEKKEQAIKDAVDKNAIEKKPVEQKEIILTGNGESLCFDKLSGRYFQTDINKLKAAANELNRRMRNEMSVTLNEFYYEVGLDGIDIGNNLGWDIDHGYIDLEFSSQLTPNGQPCLVVGHGVPPRYDCVY